MLISKHIKYHKGFKYQLVEDAKFQIKCKVPHNIQTDYINLNTNGELTIKDGYAWDGPSGPTIDTKNFMRGSLVHDALYQLMRQELLPIHEKENADNELKRLCLADGMTKLRAWWVIKGLNMFGKASTLPENKRDTLIAPH